MPGRLVAFSSGDMNDGAGPLLFAGHQSEPNRLHRMQGLSWAGGGERHRLPAMRHAHRCSLYTRATGMSFRRDPLS